MSTSSSQFPTRPSRLEADSTLIRNDRKLRTPRLREFLGKTAGLVAIGALLTSNGDSASRFDGQRPIEPAAAAEGLGLQIRDLASSTPPQDVDTNGSDLHVRRDGYDLTLLTKRVGESNAAAINGVSIQHTGEGDVSSISMSLSRTADGGWNLNGQPVDGQELSTATAAAGQELEKLGANPLTITPGAAPNSLTGDIN